MSKPRISIIIPVYGVETFIEKCITSVIKQTFSEFEVIVVDDGSLDKSISIAKNVCNEDPRFKFVEQVNSGLSAARNFGLSFATGAYVIFLDSDDYWHPEFLHEMISSAYSGETPHDVVVSACFLVNEKDDILKKIQPHRQVLSQSDALKESLVSGKIKPLAQLMLIKREIALLYPFPIGCYYEDRSVTLRYLYSSNSIILCDTAIYYYLQRSGSIMTTLNRKKVQDRMVVMSHIKQFLMLNNVFEDFSFEYKVCLLNTVISAGFKQILKTEGRNIEFERLLLNSAKLTVFTKQDILKMLMLQPRKTFLILSLLKNTELTMKFLKWFFYDK